MVVVPSATQTVVITGGNAGLGDACARAIAQAQAGWLIVIASRDERRGADAAARLNAAAGGSVAQALTLDLASLRSVRNFAGQLASRELPPLHALVCNAGLQIVSGVSQSEDGFETTFAVNHLGHCELIRLLLEQLVAPARIVLVSSGTHDPAQRTGMPAPQLTDAQALASPEQQAGPDGTSAATTGRRRYTTSKLCNVLTTYELARRLQAAGRGEEITVNAFDPGLMPDSGLARDYRPMQRVAYRLLAPALRLMPGVNSVAGSGRALARLARSRPRRRQRHVLQWNEAGPLVGRVLR